MIDIYVEDASLAQAAQKGADDFLKTVTLAVRDAIGGTLTADNMSSLNASQITLLAYDILREEVLDGGFVQLIHNGYGGFIFLNPVAKILKMWGLTDLAKILFRGRKLYYEHHEAIERDCTDEEFMALFEQHPEFDDMDDAFVEHEEDWTTGMAEYVDEHLNDFVKVRQ